MAHNIDRNQLRAQYGRLALLLSDPQKDLLEAMADPTRLRVEDTPREIAGAALLGVATDELEKHALYTREEAVEVALQIIRSPV